jgi:hypothetical protein
MTDNRLYKEIIAELKEHTKMFKRFNKGEITESEFEEFISTHDIDDLYRRIDELENTLREEES